MLDIHFDNQVLRLASVNCEAEILLKNVLQKKSDSLNLTSTTHHKLQPTKIGETHQYFACILRYIYVVVSRVIISKGGLCL